MFSPGVLCCNSLRRAARVILLGTIVSATLLSGKRGIAAEDAGYDDTPRLPDSAWRVHDRHRPQPTMVEPGATAEAPPADAIILFDGKDLAEWQGGDPRGIENGCINIRKTGELRTKRSFGDCQLHVEWATPAVADGNAMNWGNSGVFFLAEREAARQGAARQQTRRPRVADH